METHSINTAPIIEKNFRGHTRDIIIPGIIDTIEKLAAYWPLTLRQVYYQLVAGQMIENNLNRYNSISRTLSKLRRLEVVPWDCIEDRSRRLTDKRGFSDAGTFARQILNNFSYYDRCLIQNQTVFCEVWTEKDALSKIFEDTIWKYCIRVVICRGQLSTSFVHDYSERVRANAGRKPVILHFGDLDPSGCKIPFAVKENLRKWHGIDVDVRRIALNPDQIHEYNLPHSPEAVKKKDPNYKWYIKNYGEYAVELDAIHPEMLIKMIEQSIQNTLDIEDMLYQQEIQNREREKLNCIKSRVQQILEEEGF